jgi:hypothetical protein
MKATLLLISSLLSQPAFAGHEVGHGGGAIVCRNSQKQIESAELLDLWEANVTHENISYSQDSVDSQMDSALERLSAMTPYFAHKVKERLSKLPKLISYLPEGMAIAPPKDAEEQFLKEGCALEGVAKYTSSPDDHDTLYINPRITAKMSPTDQAALYLHEAIYKVLRDESYDEDSIRTRRAVRMIFGKAPIPSIPKEDHLLCEDSLFQALVMSIGGEVKVWTTRRETQWLLPIKENKMKSHPDQNLVTLTYTSVPTKEEWLKLPQSRDFVIDEGTSYFNGLTIHRFRPFSATVPPFVAKLWRGGYDIPCVPMKAEDIPQL